MLVRRLVFIRAMAVVGILLGISFVHPIIHAHDTPPLPSAEGGSRANISGLAVGALSGTTDATGRIILPHQFSNIYGMLVAVQHDNGNWHTLENSMVYDVRFWWNDQEVRGILNSPDFANNAVKVIVFYEANGMNPLDGLDFAVYTGTTGGAGGFSIIRDHPGETVGMLAAIQHSNGNWHTLESTVVCDNRFWWNADELAGQINCPQMYNRPVRVIAFYLTNAPSNGQLPTAILTGQTDADGRYTIENTVTVKHPPGTRGGKVHIIDGMLAAVRHENGNWHTIQNSDEVDNRFWWNDDEVRGLVASPRFANNSVKVIMIFTEIW